MATITLDVSEYDAMRNQIETLKDTIAANEIKSAKFEKLTLELKDLKAKHAKEQLDAKSKLIQELTDNKKRIVVTHTSQSTKINSVIISDRELLNMVADLANHVQRYNMSYDKERGGAYESRQLLDRHVMEFKDKLFYSNVVDSVPTVTSIEYKNLDDVKQELKVEAIKSARKEVKSELERAAGYSELIIRMNKDMKTLNAKLAIMNTRNEELNDVYNINKNYTTDILILRAMVDKLVSIIYGEGRTNVRLRKIRRTVEELIDSGLLSKYDKMTISNDD